MAATSVQGTVSIGAERKWKGRLVQWKKKPKRVHMILVEGTRKERTGRTQGKRGGDMYNGKKLLIM